MIKNKNEYYVSNLIIKIKQDCESIYDFDFKVIIALGYAEKSEELLETEAVMTLSETRMYINKLVENNSARSGTISSLLETLHEKHSETEEHTIIINIVDSFDVMTHKRIYKDASNNEYALEELNRCAGTQFDLNIVKRFMEVLNEEH